MSDIHAYLPALDAAVADIPNSVCKKFGRVLVVNCGSIGQPVDGDPRLCYTIISFENKKAERGRILRVEYELNRIMEAMEGTSLPMGLRKDLASGSKRMFLR